MKRCLLVLLCAAVLALSSCVPQTVRSGGAVVRGSATSAPTMDYAALADQQNLVFITLSGDKYHTADCVYISDTPIALTLEQALAEGYTPCSRCCPN